MRQISLFFVCITFFLSTSALQAQKIAYMDLEAAIAMMPETRTAEQTLQTFQQKLGQGLQATDNYLRSLIAEYQELAGSGATEADLEPKVAKIRELQAELQTKQSESQQQFANKQAEVMAPILEKLEKAMKDHATTNGYTYVLNTSSNGTSIILHGVDTDNITKVVLEKLGVEIPEPTDK